MVAKPFTVQNMRPRRTVNLYGQVLAASSSAGRSSLDITAEELLGEACVKMLKDGRLRVTRGFDQPEFATLTSLLTVEAEAAIDSVPSIVEVPAVEIPVVEVPPAIIETPLVVVQPEVVETPVVVVEPVVEEIPSGVVDTSDSRAVTEKLLHEMTTKEIKAEAKKYDLSTSGSKAEITDRVLKHLFGDADA